MNIYILLPKDKISGGPELAHQLCYSINTNTDAKAYMCYCDFDAKTTLNFFINVPAPEPYRIYNTETESSFDVVDRPGNVVVIPEGITGSIQLFQFATMVLWWMSVDNYIHSTGEQNLELMGNKITLHLYQSYYSMDYVEKKIPGAKGIYLSDYVNEEHGKFLFPAECRLDMALYNPKKGYDKILPFIEKITWLKWRPLLNLSVEEMVVLMQSGKIYLDFGKHPGKDRIPREAAVDGCCVITNKEGSAAYEKDVPIPENYKFSDPISQMDEIEALMKDICENFKTHQDRFASYRDMIHSEKTRFDKDVVSFVKLMSEILKS